MTSHAMPFGAQIGADGVRFALWAPSAREVALVLRGEAPRPMEREADGWHRLVAADAMAGDDYAFRIDDGLVAPDPASRHQPHDAHGASRVVDPDAYRWRVDGWRGRPWSETVLYELHVGTFTPEGTYAAAAARLESLRDLGVTAVELMPLADFPGARGWGYDGVLPFAPDGAYGPPEALKALVDHAHELGLMVFLDVVYNHFGPSGNYLHAYADRFFTDRHHTPWGKAINMDGPGRENVRDFFVHNALYWLEEYRFDGLRFDAVHAILDDSRPRFLEELATRVRAALPGRHVHLVLENDANEARWLERGADGRAGLYDAQWNDDAHHVWHALLTGEEDGYYSDYADRRAERLARVLAQGFDYQGAPSPHRGGERRGEPSAHLPPTAFVDFIQNHDQIGNRAFGERLTALAAPERLALARAALLLGPAIPMLFMGDEFGARAPFLYFCDFTGEPDLARAVREGRRREFAGFAQFAHISEDDIPDPNSEKTFLDSRLDDDPGDSAIARDTRALLALRHEHIVPLLAGTWRQTEHRVEDSLIEIAWRFSGGTLGFACNLADVSRTAALPAGARVIWSSPPAQTADGALRLPAWSGAFFTESAH